MQNKTVSVDAPTKNEIVQVLIERLKAYYVFPDVAEKISAGLQKYLDEGEYTGILEGEEFALALTLHMQEVNHDKHMWVRCHPDPLPAHEGPLYRNLAWLDEQKEQARIENYGLHKVERLPGNVGYLEIRKFHSTSWSSETAVAAMNFLADTEALIVDLRQCEGGDPDMVALISSYLFGENPVHLNSIYWREDDITRQFWTLPYVPGKYYNDRPIYALTSKNTFSGGEEFVYNLKTRQRGTLIGETTGGGANPGSTHRLHPHFEAFIPSGRPINPITGTNWEGSGVAPDISVPKEQAFEAAYGMALKYVIEKLEGRTSRPLLLLRNEAQEALKELESS